MKQTQRGGGTVCQQFEPIASKYRELMADFQPCTAERADKQPRA